MPSHRLGIVGIAADGGIAKEYDIYHRRFVMLGTTAAHRLASGLGHVPGACTKA
jgi:hypothetical protein